MDSLCKDRAKTLNDGIKLSKDEETRLQQAINESLKELEKNKKQEETTEELERREKREQIADQYEALFNRKFKFRQL